MATSSKATNRQFYSLPQMQAGGLGKEADWQSNRELGEKEQKIAPSHHSSDLLIYIADNIVGAHKVFSGPFGLRKVTYLDFVASGRALKFIEDYIQDEVLSEYGNTHTTTSITSLQTTLFRHEARDIVRNACNASEHDSVIFTGSGSTGAIQKLIHSLHLSHNPIVFVGPYEHHSNILPWKEAGAEVIRVSESQLGHINMTELENILKSSQGKGRQMIGAFSAASNVTGVLTDVDAITICLHKYGALSFWDYAAAAPYVKVDVNPYIGGPNQDLVHKDAIYFSLHKFVGGVSTPGVLIAKKKLFRNPVPHSAGGGTVFFVRRENHRYLQEPEVKEEGGTPAIVESIRAGLVMQLKQAVGTDLIQQRDSWILSEAMNVWSKCKNLVILGPSTMEKLPVFSFLIYHGFTGRFLHHNFVAAILNDVFGIQARGGCACAGPYAMDLLGMKEETAREIEELIAEDSRLDRVHLRRQGEYSHREILRPGFVRLNLPYFLDQNCLHFVLEAVRLVSEHAWKLLPQYLFNPETGEWRQRNFQTFKDRKWLGHISYQSGQMKYHQPKQNIKGPLPSSYQDCLDKAKTIFSQAEKQRLKVPDQTVMFDEEAKPFRWFVLPSEANACLQGHFSLPPIPLSNLPYSPPSLFKRLSGGDSSIKNCDLRTVNGDINEFKHFSDVSKAQNVVSNTNTGCERDIDISASVLSGSSVASNSDSFSEENTKSVRTMTHDTENYNSNTSNVIQPHISSSQKIPTEEISNSNSECNRCVCGLCGKIIIHEGKVLQTSQKVVDAGKSHTAFEDKDSCNNGPSKDLFSEGLINALNVGFNKDLSSNKDVIRENSDVRFIETNESPVVKKNVSSIELSAQQGSSSVPYQILKTSHVQGNDHTAQSHLIKNGLPETLNSPADKENHSHSSLHLDHQNNFNSETGANTSVIYQSLSTIHPSELIDGKTASEYILTSTPLIPEDRQLSITKPEDAGEKMKEPLTETQVSCSLLKKKTFQKAEGNLAVKWFAPPKQIFKPTVTAMEEYSMLKDGDKVLICLSGGKDSLSLLHMVRQYQFYARGKGINFEFGAVTVDPETPAYDPSPLKQYLVTLKVPYFYESQCILETAENLPYECASICSFCSRMKRGRIYAAARREGYNVLALGQHLDDLSESFLMSFFHNGNLNTMKAHYTIKKGDLRVIRPFVYVREADLRAFAEKNKLPVIAENCPACFEAPKERHRTKQLLAAQEVMFPHVYSSMMTAMKPLMARRCISKTEDVENSREDDDID